MEKVNQEAYRTLKLLFTNIGWEEKFMDAVKEECRKSYLYGLADNAYDEWGDAYYFVKELVEAGDILQSLHSAYPSLQFKDGEYGYQYFRGCLFSLADYQLAKEAIQNLGKDDFEIELEVRGMVLPVNYHLYEV